MPGSRSEARAFAAGLMVGIAGIVVAVIGITLHGYPAVLTGSILASLGFTVVACALLSAEDRS